MSVQRVAGRASQAVKRQRSGQVSQRKGQRESHSETQKGGEQGDISR